MISKELLSEVLGKEVTNIKKPYKDNKKYIYYDGLSNGEQALNTYELAHKCKEWAFKKHLVLESSINQGFCRVFVSEWSGGHANEIVNCGNDKSHIHCSTTEPEAIFKACQWVLDNKDKQ